MSTADCRSGLLRRALLLAFLAVASAEICPLQWSNSWKLLFGGLHTSTCQYAWKAPCMNRAGYWCVVGPFNNIIASQPFCGGRRALWPPKRKGLGPRRHCGGAAPACSGADVCRAFCPLHAPHAAPCVHLMCALQVGAVPLQCHDRLCGLQRHATGCGHGHRGCSAWGPGQPFVAMRPILLPAQPHAVACWVSMRGMCVACAMRHPCGQAPCRLFHASMQAQVIPTAASVTTTNTNMRVPAGTPTPSSCSTRCAASCMTSGSTSRSASSAATPSS